ncbi:MAG: L-arabinose isomerase [Trueperaceae bacterium]
MNGFEKLEVWFLTGSQHLYGEGALRQVASDASEIAGSLGNDDGIAIRIVPKPVLTTSDEIYRLCLEANSDAGCIGLMTWMHTFSPAKMWIRGLKALHKPFMQLHTQYGRDIPWASLDMDFMNLHQTAHGGREFGFVGERLRLSPKVVVGHWRSESVRRQLDTWCRAAAAWHDSQELKIARFGDNMRNVAVSDGDKVSAEIGFGYSVIGYGVGDLAERVVAAAPSAVDELLEVYDASYRVAPELRPNGARRGELREAARIEIGLRSFLVSGGFKGFTTTFEDLHGLSQLPGLAVQRLMADGYGFGAEGDWKTAALLRSMKVMAQGLDGGTSFMEDYTYHLDPDRPAVLGAHMLEVCPSTAGDTPTLEMHPLSIGGKADPARLVFDVTAGPAVNASVIDLGDRFRMIVGEVDVVAAEQPLPKLPVARALWQPRPDLETATAAWIMAGGAHHTGFSKALKVEHLEDFAEMAGVELFVIDERTRLRDVRSELRWNSAFYRLAGSP